MEHDLMDKNKSAYKLKNIGPIYYINLDGQPERKEYMESLFKYWEIENYERVSGYDGRDDDLSDNDDDDINEANQYNKPNFYVQFLATCSDIDGNTVEKLVTFNFQTEDIYNEHMESGFEECDTYFEDSININHPGCNYEYEWDEYKIYAEEYPDPDDMIIIDIY